MEIKEIQFKNYHQKPAIYIVGEDTDKILEHSAAGEGDR